MYAKALIDKAREQCRSDAQVARMIGISPQMLNRIKQGTAKMSPESAAILAGAIGDDASYAAQRVMMENARPEMATRLQKAFRLAVSVVGVVVGFLLAAAPYDANAKCEQPHVAAQLPVYTLSRLRRLKKQLQALMARWGLGWDGAFHSRGSGPRPPGIAAAGLS